MAKAKSKANPKKVFKSAVKKTVTTSATKKVSAPSKAAAKTLAKSGKATSAPYQIYTGELFASGQAPEIPMNRGPRYYCVVEAISPDNLTRTVQNKINDGWIPQGSLTTGTAGGLIQALVKY